jgi:hypothetical protein
VKTTTTTTTPIAAEVAEAAASPAGAEWAGPVEEAVAVDKAEVNPVAEAEEVSNIKTAKRSSSA